MMKKIIESTFEESARVKKRFGAENMQRLSDFAGQLSFAFERGNKLIIFGNGGSAADAQHLAAEFVNRFQIERPPLPALALTTDSSIILSIGNDYDFSEVFSKQVKALGKKGDVALGISTSGNSLNVLKALRTARAMNIKTAALTGNDGGKIGNEVDILLNVDSNSTPRIQETHLTACHLICDLVEKQLFGHSE